MEPKHTPQRLTTIMTACALLVSVASQAVKAADFAITAGQSYMQEAGPGVWQQPPYKCDITSSADSIGLSISGDTALPWLGWTAGYADLGRVHGGPCRFVDDKNYNRDTQEISYPCEDCGTRGYKYRADFAQRTQMIYATLDGRYNLAGSRLFLRGGVALWRADFQVHIFDRLDGLTKRLSLVEYDMSPYYEVGVERNRVSFSVYAIPSLRGMESAWTNAIGARVGYSF